ncbi:MAG TPA: aldehyde dehydrogenase family protein [Caulobacteraceae bacterium]|nr:aldehyde dehydrogenase family protein [Caulobacteraceae bacterium]
MSERLKALTPGMPIPFGGDRLARVSPELADAFQAGDRLIVVQETGDLLHVPAGVQALAEAAVGRAIEAFGRLARASDEQIGAFFEVFAGRLADDRVWAPIAAANAEDVGAAKARGRSTTRLVASARMRAEMIAGLSGWRDAKPSRGRLVERIEHDGWSVEQVTAPLGVVGFVFEGRPNVFADAAGVLRGGNAVVFRIGSDALGTARAIVRHALEPALDASGLPSGACVLVESPEHAAGWALFSDRRLALAVARGSGHAVAQLGAVARQAGVPVSLHGTGGAWLIADDSADAARFRAVVERSIDRKVCNTLNVCCIVRDRAAELVPLLLEALADGSPSERGWKLHVVHGDEAYVPDRFRASKIVVHRAEGSMLEEQVEPLPLAELGREWEWERTPEITLKIVDDLTEAISLCNRYSPRLAASLIAEDPAAQGRFEAEIEAAFVGDGMTRWVDGQYALGRPELGLSNWENGRLLARGGVLAGDSVFTVRTRMRQRNVDLHR